MNIIIDNGWRGPIENVARLAALSVRADGQTAVLALQTSDRAGQGPRVGVIFEANGASWEVSQRLSSPSGLLSYICTRSEREADNG